EPAPATLSGLRASLASWRSGCHTLRGMRWRVATTIVLVAVAVSVAAAQLPRGGRGRAGGGFYGRPLRYATLDDFDGTFQFCRIVTNFAPDGDGGSWNVDFPRADENLSIRLSELTK